MERLTGRNEFGESTSYNPTTDKTAGDRQIRDRLAAYESTGLMPEEVTDLRERCEAAEVAMSDIVDGVSRCDFCRHNPNTCGAGTVYSCGGFDWRGPQGQKGAEE